MCREVTKKMGPGFSQQLMAGGRETKSEAEPGCKAGCKDVT